MNFVRSSALTVLATGLLLSNRLCAAEPGAIDIGSFIPPAKGEYVEVNIQPALLSFAARLTEKKDPEASQVLKGLKSVHVNVVKLDDTNRADAVERIKALREKLNSEGWQKTVTVRGNNHENVDVLVKIDPKDTIQGVVVTVINENKEAVVVNVVGEIKPEQLAALGDRLEIDGLKHVHIKKHAEDKNHADDKGGS